MFRKMIFLSVVTVILAASFLCFIGTDQAFAQENDPPKDTSCMGCHADQYYLFDHGKWYCLCKTHVRCTDCHGGRTDTVVQEQAHEGMLANPLVNDAAVCQSCHPDEYRAKVQKFASIAGISSTPRPYATCTPPALVLQSVDSEGGARLLRALPPGAWQVVGFSFLGIAFLAVFLFACRCWKSDHLCKFNRQEGG